MTPESDLWGWVSMVMGLVLLVWESHLWCGTASGRLVYMLHRHSRVLWQTRLCWCVGGWISISREYYLRNGRTSLVLWDDHFHMGGSGDMKLDVVMVVIVLIWDFIFMFLGLDLVLYIVWYLYILYITLFRLIVLFSRCRVNWDTNMSVVCVLCNIFLLPLCVWAPYVAFPTCGAHPHWATVCSMPQ